MGMSLCQQPSSWVTQLHVDGSASSREHTPQDIDAHVRAKNGMMCMEREYI